MSHFIYDNTSLDFPKTDLHSLPVGADPTQYVQSSEWNRTNQALIDTKTQLRGGKWFGFEAQGSDPNPASVTNYLWLSTLGILTVRLGLTTLQLVNATRQIVAGDGLEGGGTLAGDVTLSLETVSPSPAGTYVGANITVDAKGRITAASSGTGGYATLINNASAQAQRSRLQVDGNNLTLTDDSGNDWTALRLGTNITVNQVVSGQIWTKTHSAFTGSEYKRSTGAVQTTGTTPTVLATFPVDDTTVNVYSATIIARGVAGVERAMYTRKVLVYREGGGATMQGSVINGTDVETSGGLDATFVISSNNVVLQVTGLAATTINWVASIDTQTVSTNT